MKKKLRLSQNFRFGTASLDLITVMLFLLFFAVQNGFTQETSALVPPDKDSAPLASPSASQTPVPPSAPAQRTPSVSPQTPSSTPAQKTPSASPETPSTAPEQTQPSTSADGGAAANTTGPARPQNAVYMGLIAGVSLNTYDSKNNIVEDMNGRSGFAIGPFFGMTRGNWSFEAEALLSGDNGTMEISNRNSYSEYDFSAWSFMIPLIVKYEFKLGPVVIQPLAGFSFNFALGDFKIEDIKNDWEKPLFGLMFGGDVGVNVGRGRIFADLRYAVDLGNTEIDDNFKMGKSLFMISLGYQYFLSGKKER
jgi:hypothetical protein